MVAQPIDVIDRPSRKTPGRLLPCKLGEYELFDHIGKGGMADIYRARRRNDLGVVRELVLKEVLPELAGEERFSELLVAEAKLAAKLSHPNVVRVEYLGRDSGSLYIAMEHVDGLDLRELFRRCAATGTRIGADMALRVAIDVLSALDYAHRFRFEEADRIGIIHRDVSPSNVLLSLDGEVKLCDFGIARAHDAGDVEPRDVAAGHLSSVFIEGKAGYMSPEQAWGEPLDGRADVFALGIILFEMLSGKKLYRKRDGASLLEVARRASIPPLPAMGLPHHDEISGIVAKALAPRREDRFASADEMRRAVEAYAVKSGLLASSIRLGEWLCDHFEGEITRVARRRALAVEALRRGPIVALTRVAPVEPAHPAPIAAPVDLTPAPSTTPTPTPIRLKKKRAKKEGADTARKTPRTAVVASAPLVVAPRQRSRAPWIIVALVVTAAIAVGVWFALHGAR